MSVNSFKPQSDFAFETLTKRVWQELSRAPHDRHHDWKRPALASIGLDGAPEIRTIILRHADVNAWTLTAYTDARSSKCAELKKCDAAQLVFWSSRLNWQLRVKATVTIETDGLKVAEAWGKVSQTNSSKDYLSVQVPGTEITLAHDHEEVSASTDSHHFAILLFHIESMDWLLLDRDGHRRARILRDGQIMPLTP